MTLIIVLNAVFAAFVVVGIVGLHLYAIAKDHAEHAGSSLVRAATRPGRAPARHRPDRGARREIGRRLSPKSGRERRLGPEAATSGQALS
jgi:hypothetical protein